MVKKTNSRKSPRVLDVNKVYQGNSIDVLKTFPDESLDMCITSPPYWGLRDYGTEGQIWGGDENCEHDFDKSKRKLHSGTNSQGGLPHHKNASIVDWEVEDAVCNKCGAWRGELGLEPTPEMFVNNLCDIFDEVKRVLRPHGTCWVNLGDSYVSGKSRYSSNPQTISKGKSHNEPGDGKKPDLNKHSYYQDKSLAMVPSLFAIEMIKRKWILRNEIIWHKPSCMPSSATDRFTVDFEKMFFFTKNKKYYFKQQFEPITESSRKRAEYGWDGVVVDGIGRNSPEKTDKMGDRWVNPSGRNKRTVWSINTASFKGAHFAVYPPELIESPIDAGCPLYVCTKCEKPREIILESPPNPSGISGRAGTPMVSKDGKVDTSDGTRRIEKGHNSSVYTNSKFVGYTDCGCSNSKFIETPIDAGCPEYVDKKTGEARERVIKKKSLERHELPKDNPNYRPERYEGKYKQGQRYAVYDDEGYNDDKKDSDFKPGVVLDPFFGSGTTAEVAMKQGKDWVGIDLNDEYIGISKKRLEPTIKEKKTRDKASEFWE